MIYIKLKNSKKIYNSNTLKDLKREYPRSYYIALHRIIKNTLNNELKNYPDIDIVITDKKQSSLLGRFYSNKHLNHREYKFIKQQSGNPYIVLFANKILNYFFKNKVKGLKEVFLHEAVHYKQWLLNEPLGHSKELSAYDDCDLVERKLKVLQDIINNTRG